MSEYMIIDWFWRDVGTAWLILLSMALTATSACMVKYYCGEDSEDFRITVILSCVGLIPLLFIVLLFAPVITAFIIAMLLFALAIRFITNLVPEKNNPS